jgi:hypothetical protein
MGPYFYVLKIARFRLAHNGHAERADEGPLSRGEADVGPVCSNVDS